VQATQDRIEQELVALAHETRRVAAMIREKTISTRLIAMAEELHNLAGVQDKSD